MKVEKARELLGKRIDDFSDVQVEQMIQRDSAMIEVIMDIFEKELLTYGNKPSNN